MSVKEHVTAAKALLPEQVTLVAVSKNQSVERILEAYTAGQRIFGENRVQELVEKWKALPKDIEWHSIGHVQRNKVKHMAEFVSLIQGVDSLRLLEKIDEQAQKHNRVIRCLLQLHIAQETTKFGLTVQELKVLLDSKEYQALTHVKVVGLMGIATLTDDEAQIRQEFDHLKSVFDWMKERLPEVSILSMGMSADYNIALAAGSTMVRIGSYIFGRCGFGNNG